MYSTNSSSSNLAVAATAAAAAEPTNRRYFNEQNTEKQALFISASHMKAVFVFRKDSVNIRL